ncbi:alkaline shock response membrane anchor protein AmaP [Paenibacillus sp. y28]|uniref:alkaline shock response membrane anchor protein AmaP n=1 Tax=Paenibacillus sp. y28 TaxID=3129110 RepID=UPI0030180FA9
MAKVLDRLLLFVYSIIIGVISVAVLLLSSAIIPKETSSLALDKVYLEPSVAYPTIIVSVVMLLLSLRMFYITVRRGRSQAPSIDQRTDYGDIRISLETVENLALKAAGRVRGVKDLKTRVNVTDSGLDIVIRAVVDGESSIPDLTEEVQRNVKLHVEEITGIPVAGVAVFVANILQTNTFKSRVE